MTNSICCSPSRSVQKNCIGCQYVPSLLPKYSVSGVISILCSLAYAEMRLIFARLVYNFDPELVDPKKNRLGQEVHALWRKPAPDVSLTPVHQERVGKVTVK